VARREPGMMLSGFYNKASSYNVVYGAHTVHKCPYLLVDISLDSNVGLLCEPAGTVEPATFVEGCPRLPSWAAGFWKLQCFSVPSSALAGVRRGLSTKEPPTDCE